MKQLGQILYLGFLAALVPVMAVRPEFCFFIGLGALTGLAMQVLVR